MSYIPKDSTQQCLFLSKYPEFDGRGIKIAIIDSLVDVSLDGLQKTSEGLPKIIDCFDFSEAGNVDTSVVREMDSENILIGLSGRKFKIPTKWRNPSGKWHLGLQSLYKPRKTSEDSVEKLPELDCIVWFNGQKWLACIETFEENLENAKMITNFRDNYEYGILSNNFCYCITVSEEGNLLEILMPYINHGSVVAQTAAANFPDTPMYNGLAPGAQIISMNVLEPEIINRKSFLPIEKALLKCIEMKVDIVNYSIERIGGNQKIKNLIKEMVEKHNILIFKSAGNRGPFYSTINEFDRPIQHFIFSIGALLTREIKNLIYNFDLGKDYPATVISNVSSRGPDKNGNLGIDFVAPGGVVTEMPKFNLLKTEFSHGTSFSSPIAAGSIACLLTALRANSIKYSPSMIKFVLFKTAKLPKNGNKLEFGNGMIQIDSAFNYCKTELDEISTTLWSLRKSIKIRFLKTTENQNIAACVLDFPDLTKFITDKSDVKWILEVSTEDFIEVTESDSGHSFTVKIEKSKMEEGSLNFTEIHVLHPLNPSFGPVFNIPVILYFPFELNETDNYRIQREITLNYDIPNHIFIDPCFESNKIMKMKITALQNFETKLLIEYNTDNIKVGTTAKIFKFSDDNRTHTYFIPVRTNKTHEICVEQIIKDGYQTTPKFQLDFFFERNEQKCVTNTIKSKDTVIIAADTPKTFNLKTYLFIFAGVTIFLKCLQKKIKC